MRYINLVQMWLCVLVLATAACTQVFPVPARVVADQAKLYPEPKSEAVPLAALKKGDMLILHGQGPSAQWYAVQLEESRMSWIRAAWVAPIVSEKEQDWLTASVVQSFGATPAQARMLFGPPRKSSKRILTEDTGNCTEEMLFFPGHRATYTEGLLTRVQLGALSSQRLGPWRLGQDAAVLDELESLGKCEEFKGGRTFSVEPDAFATFFIKHGKIVGISFDRVFHAAAQ